MCCGDQLNPPPDPDIGPDDGPLVALGPARRGLRVRREFAPLTPRPRAFIGSFASLMAFKLCTCMSDIGISRTFIDAFASSAPTVDIDQPSGPEREQNAFGGLTVEGDSHD